VDPDPDHSVGGTAEQIYGPGGPTPASEHNLTAATMSGFVSSYAATTNASFGPTIMDAFTPAAVPVISALARAFTVLDGYHASVPACTFPNRLFALSGTSHGFADNDDVQTALGWPQRSIFAALNEANASYRVYFSDAPTPLLMADARNLSEVGKYRGIAEFAADAGRGDLPAFTWLDPSYMDIPGVPATDQHPAHDVADGERLLKGLYEALRASPLWNESVLLVTYDEHGGFADHVPPPVAGVPSPDGRPCVDCGRTPFNFTRLGVRVPMLVVSPWAAARVVHAPAPPAAGAYEHASLPRTLADVVPGWRGPLTARDAWALPLTPLWEGTDMPDGPRGDTPATLPEPPAASPSQAGAVRDGSGRASHIQGSLLRMALGAAAARAGAPDVPAAVEAALLARGGEATRTGAAAGRALLRAVGAALAA